jgi:predicted DNA-binding protein with PD1-like motif
MRFELIQQNGSLRTFALDFATGDEVVAMVKQFVATQQIFAAEITALGGLSAVTLLCFDLDKGDYVPTTIQAQLELAMLMGQVGQPPAGGDAAVHMHAVVAKTDATAFAGHLGAATVRPIVQMIITEVGEPLRKIMSAKAAFLLGRNAE